MEEDKGIGNIPPGYHFKPHPEELVESYLRPRLVNQPLPCHQFIKEMNIYDFHPKDILGNTPAGKHLYFFAPKKMKYSNRTRPACGTNGGYWKASGQDMIIRDKYQKEIGRRMSLVFHEGHQHHEKKKSWLMQEYTIKEFWLPTDQNKDELGALALCEIYRKPTSNQSMDGELPVDEQEEEEVDEQEDENNVFVDRRVWPCLAPCNHGNNQSKTPVASTNGCPLDSLSAITPIAARSGSSIITFRGCNNLRNYNMVLLPQSSVRPRGPHAMGYSSSHQMRPLFAHRQPSQVACSSRFVDIGGLL